MLNNYCHPRELITGISHYQALFFMIEDDKAWLITIDQTGSITTSKEIQPVNKPLPSALIFFADHDFSLPHSSPRDHVPQVFTGFWRLVTSRLPASLTQSRRQTIEVNYILWFCHVLVFWLVVLNMFYLPQYLARLVD